MPSTLGAVESGGAITQRTSTLALDIYYELQLKNHKILYT